MSFLPTQLVARFTIALLWLIASPALAQERLFVFRGGSDGALAELDTSESGLGTVRWAAQLRHETKVTPLPGGRFLLLSYKNSALQLTFALFDTRTCTTSVIPQWTFPPTVGDVALESDAFRSRIFYRTYREFGVIEGPSFAPRVMGATDDDSPSCCGQLRYVAATNTLLLTRNVSGTHAEIVGIDADSGAPRGSITLDGSPGALLVDNASRRLRVPVGVGPYSSSTRIQTYALDTFAFLNQTPAYPVPLCSGECATESRWTFDVTRQQILRSDPRDGGFGPWAVVLDANLTAIAREDFGYIAELNRGTSSMRVMPSTVRDRTFAILGRHAYNGSHGPHVISKVFLVALDAMTLRPLATIDVLGTSAEFTNGHYDAILLSPPPPPSPLASAITGRRVQLTWRNPGDTTHFIVEVGTIPGRSNLGILHVGNTTQFTAENVPPGRYYARVRAINDVGLSLASNEVVVDVR